ncbi:MAG: Nitrogen regulation protein NtrC [Myxococcaceae bacterium]|nr:Nitrogen regulation protein NtrC [Myxococcaceae bacterium]
MRENRTAPSPDITLPEALDNSAMSAVEAEARTCLILLFCERSRSVGAVAHLPEGKPGPLRMLGRGASRSEDPYERLTFGLQRPGSFDAVPPFESESLSRVQLLVRDDGEGGVQVERRGRLEVRLNGEFVERHAVAGQGDVLQLGKQMLLLVSRRPLHLAGPSSDYPCGGFGAPDLLGIVGESPPIWRLRERIAHVAKRPGHVLVLGESGTGKELAARAVHKLSSRGKKLLVARNAATIPDGLAAAELFGNAKNFPNPGIERVGLVGEAHGSALYLDEVGELPEALQAQLLRVLDDGEYHRLGDSAARTADVRLIAATNRPRGRLKHDLAARFMHQIEVPGLNQRIEDIPFLVRELLQRMTSKDAPRATPDAAHCTPELSLSLLSSLVRHRYSLHTRELQCFLEQSLTVSKGRHLRRSPEMSFRFDPHCTLEGTVSPSSISDAGSDPEPEPKYLQRVQAVLDANNGSVANSWQELGLSSRHVLDRLIRKHRLIIRKTAAPS